MAAQGRKSFSRSLSLLPGQSSSRLRGSAWTPPGSTDTWIVFTDFDPEPPADTLPPFDIVLLHEPSWSFYNGSATHESLQQSMEWYTTMAQAASTMSGGNYGTQYHGMDTQSQYLGAPPPPPPPPPQRQKGIAEYYAMTQRVFREKTFSKVEGRITNSFALNVVLHDHQVSGELQWIMTSGDGIPAVVGRIALRLEPNPVELTKTLFISLIAEQADLESANDGLQSELTLARTERATAQDDLLRFAWAARERDDGNLLKLLELVNSKKFKIKQLEARLAHLEQKLARLGSDDDGRELGLLDSGNQLPVLATGHYKPLGTLVPARVEDPPVVSVRGKKGGATAAPRKRSAAAVKPARLAGPGGPSTTVGLLPEQRKRVIPEPAPPEDSDTASGGGNEAGDTDTE